MGSGDGVQLGPCQVKEPVELKLFLYFLGLVIWVSYIQGSRAGLEWLALKRPWSFKHSKKFTNCFWKWNEKGLKSLNFAWSVLVNRCRNPVYRVLRLYCLFYPYPTWVAVKIASLLLDAMFDLWNRITNKQQMHDMFNFFKPNKQQMST